MSRTYRRKPKGYEGNVPKWFKRMNRQEERAKQNQALREDKGLPVVKRRDSYEYW